MLSFVDYSVPNKVNIDAMAPILEHFMKKKKTKQKSTFCLNHCSAPVIVI